VRVNWQPLRQALVPQTFFELLQPLRPEALGPEGFEMSYSFAREASRWPRA